jgi:hypothetical protein
LKTTAIITVAVIRIPQDLDLFFSLDSDLNPVRIMKENLPELEEPAGVSLDLMHASRR